MRRSLGGVAGCLALLWAVAAASVAAESLDPQALVRRTADRVLGEVLANKAELNANPSRIYDLVQRHVVPYFDFRQMTQAALGRHWRSATEAQRTALTREFQELLVRTYGVALLNYSGQQIEYLPVRTGRPGDDVTVQTKVAERGAPPIPIDYRLSKASGDWKVFDVVIDGVSLVSNYRTSFAEEVQRFGLDGLIQKLADRNKRVGG
jgi:phospholipid transport system substrate-binding protein